MTVHSSGEERSFKFEDSLRPLGAGVEEGGGPLAFPPIQPPSVPYSHPVRLGNWPHFPLHQRPPLTLSAAASQNAPFSTTDIRRLTTNQRSYPAHIPLLLSEQDTLDLTSLPTPFARSRAPCASRSAAYLTPSRFETSNIWLESAISPQVPRGPWLYT